MNRNDTWLLNVLIEILTVIKELKLFLNKSNKKAEVQLFSFSIFVFNMAKSIIEDVRDNMRSADALYRLIYVNIGVYVLLLIANSFTKLFTGTNEDIVLGVATKWLAMPGNISQLITRPWTLITYMFLHFEFFHILFNLLWLYWMGRILSEFLGPKKVFSTYILGGICGVLVYILAVKQPFLASETASPMLPCWGLLRE